MDTTDRTAEPAGQAAAPAGHDPADLAFAGLDRQAELIRAGEVSSRELTELFLRRIERLNPRLNAFRVVWAERALAEAAQADARRRGGDIRPLLGVPIAIKDEYDVAGAVTTRGTGAIEQPAEADAEVVRRLRAAGAVLVGQTLVPELTIHSFTESPTWGVTRNPWDPYRTPGGSSGGSAAAVAAGLAGAALAADGAGSIRIPAGCCGLFGLKPQRGRVPTAPKVEPWQDMSVPGTITRRVADSARFYDAVGDGAGGFAEAARRAPGRLRIAVSTKVPPGATGGPDAEQLGAVEGTAALLRELGHEVFERELDYGMAGMAAVARYLRGIADEVARIEHPERLSRRTRSYARMGGLIPAALIARARAGEAADTARLCAIFDAADVVLTPMFTHRPHRIGAFEGRGAMWTLNAELRFVPYPGTFNHTGQPAASVPAGFTGDGFPLAVQLVGRPHDEETLLSLSAQLEQARGWPDHRPPLAG